MATKPTVPDLKELFKQAAEIAKDVPENMQETAFNRALDMLTHGLPAQSHPSSTGGTPTTAPKKRKSNSTLSD